MVRGAVVTVEPIESVEAWISGEVPSCERQAQHAARDRLAAGVAVASIHVLEAKDERGNCFGALVYEAALGDDPYLVFVERDQAPGFSGLGKTLFEAMRKTVDARPIEAITVGEDGPEALARWGFVKHDNGWWSYDGP